MTQNPFKIRITNEIHKNGYNKTSIIQILVGIGLYTAFCVKIDEIKCKMNRTYATGTAIANQQYFCTAMKM